MAKSLKQRLLDEKADVERRLSILDRVPEDRFSFGTVIVVSPASAGKIYFVKTAEEQWTNIKSGYESDLSQIIYDFKESGVGYFEVYEMRTQPQPLYASD